MSADHDPLFDDWVQRARDADIVSVAKENGAAIKKRGRDWAGPCPSCGGDDGFVLTPGNPEPQKRFLCRKAGKGGDIIAMVEHILGGAPFLTIVETINKEPPPRGQSRAIDPGVTRERREERRDRESKAVAEEKRERAEKISVAEELWLRVEDYFGTVAEEYLRRRGVTFPASMADDLGSFASLDYFGFPDPEAEHQVLLGSFPCLVAAVRDVEGKVIAVHRTYLDPRDPIKLVPPGDRTRNKAKKIMGRSKGGMIRFGAIGERLAIGEGIETTRSWHLLGIGPEDVSIAAAYSLGNLAGSATGTMKHPTNRSGTIPNGVPDMERPGLILPPQVKEVIILGDGDSDRASTLAHILTAANRWRNEGRAVSYTMAPDGADFNDVLRETLGGTL